MELMGDGLIAFLAAVGVSTILWLLAETLLRRHIQQQERTFVANRLERLILKRCAGH